MPSMAAGGGIGARLRAVAVLPFRATGVSILDASLEPIGLDLTLLVASASLKSPTQFLDAFNCMRSPHRSFPLLLVAAFAVGVDPPVVASTQPVHADHAIVV